MPNWKARGGARIPRRSALLSRCIKIIVTLLLAWTVVETLYARNALSRASSIDPPHLGKEKIFIASIHWNNEAILRSAWSSAVIELAKEIGAGNVYISVLESGSWDDSKGALRELDASLEDAGISRKIVLDNTTHEEEINRVPGPSGWIKTPRGKTELRRIPYLAELRNRAMEPFYELEKKGLKFDKILWLNDVVFDNLDVRTLLATRDGEFAAACSLDFAKLGQFYDTFALRDANGQNKLMKRWPYFRSATSRQKLMRGEVVPVKSCWNGIVAMDAMPFYSSAKERGLVFRGIPDSLAEHHLEGSECCLIHADNPYSWKKGVWLNPNVRVGYNQPAYDSVHGSGSGPWLSSVAMMYGTWMNRILCWTSTPWFQDRIVLRQLAQWKQQSLKNMEPGEFCLVNEMQVLISNGWAHV